MSLPDGARSAARVLTTIATVLVTIGFVAVSVALWSLFVTVDDGGGANIGGGILALFGLVVGGLGLVLLIVSGVGAVTRRIRGRLTT